jgi:uncharacterized protein (DUF2147 family)
MYKLTVALMGAFASSFAQAATSPAEGLWRTPAYNGEVLIFACGQALCGKIVTSDRIRTEPGLADTKNRNPALRSRPLKDLQMLEGFTGGPTEWKGGKVYNPEDGGTYKGTIRLVDADTLRLKGCIIAPFCKSQTWRRIQ